MDSLNRYLTNHNVIGLDTSIFIYFLERNPRYFSVVRPLFKGIEQGTWQGAISVITLMELTVHPWRSGKQQVARKYESVLANYPNLTLFDVNRDVARRAAQLRALHNLRPADALQVAGAVANGATVWVTNDKQLRRLGEIIDVVILDDLLAE